MFKGALIFVCGVAAGALVYDAALERVRIKPEITTATPYAPLTHPIQCDATVNGKCYVRGMRK